MFTRKKKIDCNLTEANTGAQVHQLLKKLPLFTLFPVKLYAVSNLF